MEEEKAGEELVVGEGNVPKKKVLVMLMLGLPGCGKSYFYQQLVTGLSQENIQITCVSNDDLHLIAEKQVLQRSPGLTGDALFKKAGIIKSRMFKEKVAATIRGFASPATPVTPATPASPEKFILFIDRMTMPNQFIHVQNLVHKNAAGLDVKFVAVYNQCDGYELEGRCYPFSLSMLVSWCVDLPYTTC